MGEGGIWTYNWGGERSDSEGKEEDDGSEFETEHGRDCRVNWRMRGDETTRVFILSQHPASVTTI